LWQRKTLRFSNRKTSHLTWGRPDAQIVEVWEVGGYSQEKSLDACHILPLFPQAHFIDGWRRQDTDVGVYFI